MFLSVLALAALAQDVDPDVLKRINWKAVYTLSGTCSRLTIPATNYTSSCTETLFHMEYRDGRQSWAFAARGTALISFSGMSPNDAPGGGSLFPIDHMTVASAPVATAKSETANGSCLLTVKEGNRF
jgi:hypothetical protein